MSTVTVQLGQCGNQLGSALFQMLGNEAGAGAAGFREATHEAFFRETPKGGLVARAALVDMEPKVSARWLRAAGGASRACCAETPAFPVRKGPPERDAPPPPAARRRGLRPGPDRRKRTLSPCRRWSRP